MTLELERDNIKGRTCKNYNRLPFWVENDLVVPDKKPDVLKIIKLSAKPYVTKTDVMDGKVRVDGIMAYYVIYKSTDNKIPNRSIYTTIPFTHVYTTPRIKSGMKVSVKLSVKNVLHTVPNERKINVKVEVLGNIKACEQVQLKPIKRIETNERIETYKETQKMINFLDSKTEIVNGKEEILLPMDTAGIFEILKVDYELGEKEYKFSFNKLLVKADLNVNIIYLTDEEETRVSKYSTTLPITTFVEFKELKDSNNCDIDVELRDFNIYQGNANSISCEYEAEFNVDVFENRDIEYIADLYGVDNEYSIINETCDTIRGCSDNKHVMDFSDKLDVKSGGELEVCDFSCNVCNVEHKIKNNIIYIEGMLKSEVILYNSKTQLMENKTIEIPVHKNIDVQKIYEEDNIDIEYTIKSISWKVNEQSIDYSISMNISIKTQDVFKMSIINDVVKDETTKLDCDSVVIHVAKSGENVWHVAKKYRTTVDNIVKINELASDKINDNQSILIVR